MIVSGPLGDRRACDDLSCHAMSILWTESAVCAWLRAGVLIGLALILWGQRAAPACAN